MSGRARCATWGMVRHVWDGGSTSRRGWAAGTSAGQGHVGGLQGTCLGHGAWGACLERGARLHEAMAGAARGTEVAQGPAAWA